MPARVPLILLMGQALAGLVIGGLWWWLVREPGALLVGEPVVASTTSWPIARDGVLSVLTGLAGVVAGVVVLRRTLGAPRRHPAPPGAMLLALLVGGLAGSLLAAALGSALSSMAVTPGTAAASPYAAVGVTAPAVLLVWPLAAALVVLVVTLVQALHAWVRDGSVSERDGSDTDASEPRAA